MSDALQYTVVAAVVLGALVWIVVKVFSKKSKGGIGSCHGCALSSTCEKTDKKRGGAYIVDKNRCADRSAFKKKL